MRRESDLKAVEFERLRSELSLSKSRLDQAKEHLLLREMAARQVRFALKQEFHHYELSFVQTADELDIAREKTLQLARTEQSLEKYQVRVSTPLPFSAISKFVFVFSVVSKKWST